jgi:hypothetical protein
MKKFAIIANMATNSKNQLNDILIDLNKNGILPIHLNEIGTSGGFPEYKFVGEKENLFNVLLKHNLIDNNKLEFNEFIEIFNC